MYTCPSVSFQWTCKSPPSILTRDFLPALWFRYAATAVAQAPVPHAMVMPEPLSQTLILKEPSGNTSTNSTFVRSGKSGWFSSFGPIAGKFTSFISSMKTTKCGFHIQTNVLLYSFPSTVIVFANILPSGVFICLELASRGRSMSTVTSSTSSFSVCSFRT